MEVREAKREKQKAAIAFIGASGSGKTLTSLLLAYGMLLEKYPNLSDADIWVKIGVIDTEHNRSMLYAGQSFYDQEIGSFLQVNLTPPYSADRYKQALDLLKSRGVEVIIIDSLSHQWAGPGGVVEVHGNMPGNSFQNWGRLAPETHKIVDIITNCDAHIFATLRAKTAYEVSPDANGKMVPIKIGLQPVQKDSIEFEFMTGFHLTMDNEIIPYKDNTHLFDETRPLNIEDGKALYRWLELGVDVKAEREKERIEILKELRGINDPIIMDNILQMERKAGIPLEDFNLRFMKAAKSKIDAQIQQVSKAGQ